MTKHRAIVGLALCGWLVGLAGAARADTRLELLDGRFRVSAEWRTAAGASGTAQALPLTDETGLFWFFSATNTELVVKVLNACSPYNRFWVYAAGLTDVEVELTVQDIWTGQTQTYLRPRGVMFAPIADTSTFNGCGAAKPCGRGTVSEIAATPRPNYEAEALALLLGSGITADPGIYARLDEDLERIRTLWPSLANVEAQLFWEPSTLLVGLTPSAHQALLAGQFTEWDCLNTWYHGQVETVWTIIPWAVIRFEGLFHPYRIGPDYLSLPGVVAIEDNAFLPPPLFPLDDLCVSIDGAAYDYFLFDALTYKTWYFRVPQAGATPVLIGSSGLGTQPDWWTRFEQCQANLQKAAYP